MKHIICHLVGMNNFIKKHFLEHIKNYDCISIVDLDNITNKLRKDKNLIQLYNKLDRTTNRYGLIKKINNFWKENVQIQYDKQIKNTKNNYIIVLGLCTYHKNHKLKIKIDTPNKFFLRISNKENTKNIIEYNLDTYRKEIIEGIFPLDFLDSIFLDNQREKLLNIYKNLDYKQKSLKMIYDFIEKTKQMHDKCDYVYVASKQKFKKTLGNLKKYRKNIKLDDIIKETNNKSVTNAYSDKWLALIYVIPQNNENFIKGYENGDPFVKEKKINKLNTLNEGAYIYKVPIKYFKKHGEYKFLSNKKDIPITEMEFIPNILKYYRKNIKVYKYRLE